MSQVPGPPFRRVLVANRGEIAVRIIRACHDLRMEAVAVYSDADIGAMHVRRADAAVRLGPAAASDSYLRIDRIIEAALASGAQAIHPGYGFLAERAAFARAIVDAGLVFVGPSPASIEAVGDKLAGRRLARDAGVPTVPGTLEPADLDRPDALAGIIAEATRIGFPLMVKASAGGGGRGMRRVERSVDLPLALTSASAEASASFGDGSVYLEREVRPARHIEVQLLGDLTGRVVAVGERDCSIQRRHQKLVEEAPAPGLDPAARSELLAMGVRIGTAAGLTNAATAEFLLARDGTWSFLEVNTRLQVEHGVTELTTGLDLVAEQFHLAAGRPLSDAVLAAAARASDPGRHSIEVRLAAEDPASDFIPNPGVVRDWVMPAGPGVRVDTGIEAGDRIPPEYDNLIAKVLVVAADRPAAIDRLRRALDETVVTGVQTTLPFHRFVARHPGFRVGDLSTDWVAEAWDGAGERAGAVPGALAALARGVRDEPAPGSASPPIVATATPASGWLAASREEAVDRWPR